ncbi:MAG: ribosome recycling factor [Sandaracinaceae bacterium]
MIDETLEELREGIGRAHEALKRDLSRLRTGRASADMLDSIRVDYYGTPTPLTQMASVTTPEARLLLVKPWDKSVLGAIERAIQTSPLELNPQSDGEILRIPIPALTEERRRDITKVARDHGEKCRVAIRAARHEAKDIIESLKKDGDVGEDEANLALKKLEGIVQEGNSAVDEIVSRKEKDIMTV